MREQSQVFTRAGDSSRGRFRTSNVGPLITLTLRLNFLSPAMSDDGKKAARLFEQVEDALRDAQAAVKLARQAIATSGSDKSYVVIQNHKVLRQQFDKLHDHEKEGIDFLLRKFNAETLRGCILADDMG